MSMIDSFLDYAEDGHAYEFIANNYQVMSKSELKDILLEYLYYMNRTNEEFANDVTELVADELRSRKFT